MNITLDSPCLHHLMILLANCRQLSSCRFLSGSNELGEARDGRTGMGGFCKPLTSSKNVHGRRGKQCLKRQLLASDVACSAHLTGSHTLGNRAFNPGSLGIERSKLRSLLALASFMSSSIGLLIRTQDQHSGWTLGALRMQGTGPTQGKRKSHPNDRFAMSIIRRSPRLPDLSRRTANTLCLPIDGEAAVIKVVKACQCETDEKVRRTI
jgi:hypothetical protein